MKGTTAQPQCGFSAQVVRLLHQHSECASTAGAVTITCAKHFAGRGVCSWKQLTVALCVCAWRLLCADVDVTGVDILANPALRVALKEYSKWPTFPQLYVNGEFVGGCDIATQMHQNGELAALLK